MRELRTRAKRNFGEVAAASRGCVKDALSTRSRADAQRFDGYENSIDVQKCYDVLVCQAFETNLARPGRGDEPVVLRRHRVR
jgi:hypothetical protein